MSRRLIDPKAIDARAIREAADILRRGGVVAYPTDTQYGLAVDPRSDGAVEALFSIKGRDSSAAMPLVAADRNQAREAGVFGPPEERLAAAFWPGPLTIVVQPAAGVSPLVRGAFGTVGVRVPAHAVARALAAAFGWCITATSANRSGHPAATTADEVAAALGDRVDLLLDAGPAPGGPPSTVVQIVDGRATLHRPGAVAWDRVLESLE